MIKPIKSGTDEARSVFGPEHFINFMGVDIGYGGDSIHREAINIDLPRPYTSVGNDPQHLKGDAAKLYWFNDDVLDYVYSSHLLEDFPNTKEILIEWIRVIKPGGKLYLVLPDEKQYRAYCDFHGHGRNLHHTIDDMSADYMVKILRSLGITNMMSINVGAYSFGIVAKIPLTHKETFDGAIIINDSGNRSI